ncbi:MAG: hypothetical protein AAF533_16025 [Acidobacteriota bacterium]
MSEPDWATANAEEILTSLGSIDLGAFETLLENDAFTEDHVKLLLKDRTLEAELVERISREARFFRRGSIRLGLVMHPKIPRVRGLELVPYLFWRDCLKVATSVRVHPQLRVLAEAQVAERIPELTVGERMSIARLGTRPVIAQLRNDDDLRVISALLQNFRCTEEDVLGIVNQAKNPAVLSAIVHHGKWKQRPQVKAMLVRNPRLPLPSALGLLDSLGYGELMSLSLKKDVPRLLRDSARRLATERHPSRTGRTGPRNQR